jgi:hypothetical protein
VAAGTFTPYSTVVPFATTLPGWVPAAEAERILSYQIYEEIYWNHPETFKLMLRGTDSRPIYIPSGRIIVDAICRYTAKKFSLNIAGTDAQVATDAFNALFARERFVSKLASAKKFGMIRGDWLFHVTADDTKLAGSRISLHIVDPASYFPIYDDATGLHIVKVHLAEQFTDNAGNVRVRRQTYEKLPTGLIQSSLGVFDIDKWATGDSAALLIEVPPHVLPAEITAIPVYHIRNMVQDEAPYGSSEMRGIERIMAAINQGISDQDLSLALDGLGVYRSSNGAPVDDNGEDTAWVIGPGRVVEDASFERIPGISSVAPYGDHLDRLDGYLKEVSGTPDIAVGKVDVTVAESGVALALQMAPILSRGEEKETEIKEVLAQMFYDLRFFFAAYEQISMNDVAVLPSFGDPLPVNVKAEVDLVIAMMSTVPPLMSAVTARERLARVGINFSIDEITRISQEAKMAADIASGALGGAAAISAARRSAIA